MSNKVLKIYEWCLSDTEFYNEPEGVHDILVQLYKEEYYLRLLNGEHPDLQEGINWPWRF